MVTSNSTILSAFIIGDFLIFRKTFPQTSIYFPSSFYSSCSWRWLFLLVWVLPLFLFETIGKYVGIFERCLLLTVLSSVQSLSRVWLSRPHGLQHSLSLPGLPVITDSQSLLKLMSIESVMPSNHPILCRPLLLLPSVFPSIRVISNESALHIRWPKHWSFSFSISPYSPLQLVSSLSSISSELPELCVETFLIPFPSFALDACLPPSWRIRSRPSLGVTSSAY